MSLIPPDYKRCQAEKSNGNSFMTLGGIPKRVKCENKPRWIATENEAGSDGLRGSMSLCDECKAVLIKQLGTDYCSFKEIGGGTNV